MCYFGFSLCVQVSIFVKWYPSLLIKVDIESSNNSRKDITITIFLNTCLFLLLDLMFITIWFYIKRTKVKVAEKNLE